MSSTAKNSHIVFDVQEIVLWIQNKENEKMLVCSEKEMKETLRDIRTMLEKLMREMVLSPLNGRMFAMNPTQNFSILQKRHALEVALQDHGITKDCSNAVV